MKLFIRAARVCIALAVICCLHTGPAFSKYAFDDLYGPSGISYQWMILNDNGETFGDTHTNTMDVSGDLLSTTNPVLNVISGKPAQNDISDRSLNTIFLLASEGSTSFTMNFRAPSASQQFSAVTPNLALSTNLPEGYTYYTDSKTSPALPGDPYDALWRQYKFQIDRYNNTGKYDSVLQYFYFQHNPDNSPSQGIPVPIVIANVHNGTAIDEPLELRMTLRDQTNQDGNIIAYDYIKWRMNGSYPPNEQDGYLNSGQWVFIPVDDFNTDNTVMNRLLVTEVTNHTGVRYGAYDGSSVNERVSPRYWKFDLVPEQGMTDVMSNFLLDEASNIAPGLVSVYWKQYNVNEDTKRPLRLYPVDNDTGTGLYDLRLDHKIIYGRRLGSTYSYQAPTGRFNLFEITPFEPKRANMNFYNDAARRMQSTGTISVPSTVTLSSATVKRPLSLSDVLQHFTINQNIPGSLRTATTEGMLPLHITFNIPITQIQSRTALNEILAEWRNSGEIADIFAEYFNIYLLTTTDGELNPWNMTQELQRRGVYTDQVKVFFDADRGQATNDNDKGILTVSFIVMLMNGTRDGERPALTMIADNSSEQENSYIAIRDGNADNKWNMTFFIAPANYVVNPEINPNAGGDSGSSGGGGGCNAALAGLTAGAAVLLVLLRRGRTLLLLMLAVMLPCTALAAELTLDGQAHEVEELMDDDGKARTYTTLREALDIAQELLDAGDDSYNTLIIEVTGTSYVDTSSTPSAMRLSDYGGLTSINITGTGKLKAPAGLRHFELDETKGFVIEGITLDGNGGGGVNISAGSPEFNNVTFSGIDASSNSDESNGGAVNISDGRPTFTGCSFTNCTGENGGALYISGGQADFEEQTVFEGNTATNSGGAVYSAGGTLTFRGGVSFDANTANVDGGALYTEQNGRGTLSFNASVLFSGNIANTDGSSGNGGAVWWGMDASAFNSTFAGTVSFTNNEARGNDYTGEDAGSGGAVYVASSGTFRLSGTKYAFDGNSAYNNGGSIYADAAVVNLTGLTLSDSDPEQMKTRRGSGGFLYAAGSSITIEKSTIDNYRAAMDGGAVYYKNNTGTLSITTCAFSGNTAEGGNGGAVSATAQKTNITDSYFETNAASENGGALYFDSPGENATSNATLTNNDFHGNTSKIGGAVSSIVQLDITTCYFNGNAASSKGGAVFFGLTGQNLGVTARQSTFFANHADGGQGGAISLQIDTAKINACTFDSNYTRGTTTAYGGALYLDVSSNNALKAGSVENCTFIGNRAVDATSNLGGGAALLGSIELRSCAFTQSNTASTGGGAVYVANTGSSKQVIISGTIAVGNNSPTDIYSLSNGGKQSNGYNRLGTYGTPNGIGTWEANGGAATDKENRTWTTATFYGTNTLADNVYPDDNTLPPYIGSSLPTGEQTRRLQTLMLNEAKDLATEYSATNAIPYATDRFNFPLEDQRGADRGKRELDLDIGPVIYDAAVAINDNDPPNYAISYISMSGVPNTLKSVGQSACLMATVHYTNNRIAYGGSSVGCEPITWSSSAPNIVYIDEQTGYAIARAPGQARISVQTNRESITGTPASADRYIVVEAFPASYMNTVPEVYRLYFVRYIDTLIEHDMSVSIADVTVSSVTASSFQRNFKAVWPVSSANLITDLRSSTPEFTTASSYNTSDGLSASKNAAVSINFTGRAEGDMFPLTYSWAFSGDEMKALLGTDLTGQDANSALAEKIFSALRVDYQSAGRTWTVLGTGGVSPSEALQYGALKLAKADSDRGIHIELTACIANVSATGSNDGPQFIKSAGAAYLLVVPDGTADSALTGSMWMAQKASSTNTNTSNGGSSSSESEGSGGGGGGGCSVFGLGLLGAVVFFMKRR